MKIPTPHTATAAGAACVLMTLGAASVATADTHPGAATRAARAPASHGRRAFGHRGRAAGRRANVGAPDADGYSMKMNITNKTGGPLTLVSYGEWSHNHWHQRPQQTLADSSSETLTNYSDWGGDGMSVEYQTSNGTDLLLLLNGSDPRKRLRHVAGDLQQPVGGCRQLDQRQRRHPGR